MIYLASGLKAASAALLVAIATVATARAQSAHSTAPAAAPTSGLPSNARMEMMIKQVLFTLNDAKLTGNYAVFHARLAPSFQRQYSVDRFAEIFQAFRDNNIDLSPMAVYRPTMTEGPRIDNEGILRVNGYFPTAPSRLHFDLGYAEVEGAWKLFAIYVTLKSAEE